MTRSSQNVRSLLDLPCTVSVKMTFEHFHGELFKSQRANRFALYNDCRPDLWVFFVLGVFLRWTKFYCCIHPCKFSKVGYTITVHAKFSLFCAKFGSELTFENFSRHSLLGWACKQKFSKRQLAIRFAIQNDYAADV